MSAGLAIQYAVIVLAVLVSVLVVFRKLAPQLTNHWLAAASIRLRVHGRSRFSQGLGLRLQPKQATNNCADGCATCGACGSKRPASIRTPSSTMPLRFRPRS